jgi:hypothetical protein
VNEIDVVVLTEDITADTPGGEQEELKTGDPGTIVYVHGQGEAYEVEFMDRKGNTIAVTTVLESQVRPVVLYEYDHFQERSKVVWRDPTFDVARSRRR